MKIKRWNDFLSYIKESKEPEEEFNPWMLDEDDIRDYFQESIDEGYQIEVRYGFVGEERMWNYKESKTHYVERFTKKMESGNNTPAISILITSEKVSSNDVSDNLKFAYSIIAEEADADISILDNDGEIGDIEGITAKGGLFFSETWNNVGTKPSILFDSTEADGYVEFLVKKKQEIKITQTQLAKYYDWSRYEEKDGSIYVDYNLEDLSDLLLSRDSNYKDLLIDGSGIYDSYWGNDYQPDFNSLFDYYLDKENKSLFVKALIKDAGGLEDFVSYIGDECDDMVYDTIKVMIEDKEGEPESTKEERKIKDITEYLLKERFYNTLKQMSNDSELLSDIKQSYGDWSSNAHAEKNLEEIRSEFDEILDDNFTYIKGTREVEKKSKFNKDENGNWRTYKEEETFYLIGFSNDWMEDFEVDDLEQESLETIFSEYCYKTEKTGYELKPHFSDYGDVDDKEWNKDVKSDLLRFLNK
jgi:hypothetical protein